MRDPVAIGVSGALGKPTVRSRHCIRSVRIKPSVSHLCLADQYSDFQSKGLSSPHSL